MGPLRSGPRGRTDWMGQYKTPGMRDSIRAQRGRARSALFYRVQFIDQPSPIEISLEKCVLKVGLVTIPALLGEDFGLHILTTLLTGMMLPRVLMIIESNYVA